MGTDDPPHPDGFPGSDEESHYMSSKQGFSELPETPSSYDRMLGRLIRAGTTPENTKRAMEKAGITLEEARDLRDRLFERFPELRKTVDALQPVEPASKKLETSNGMKQRQEDLSRVGSLGRTRSDTSSVPELRGSWAWRLPVSVQHLRRFWERPVATLSPSICDGEAGCVSRQERRRLLHLLVPWVRVCPRHQRDLDIRR